MEISALLLCAFPAAVLLVSIGLVSPKPVEFSLSFSFQSNGFSELQLCFQIKFGSFRYFRRYQYDLQLRILNRIFF
jgi:hypothetical protein